MYSTSGLHKPGCAVKNIVRAKRPGSQMSTAGREKLVDKLADSRSIRRPVSKASSRCPPPPPPPPRATVFDASAVALNYFYVP